MVYVYAISSVAVVTAMEVIVGRSFTGVTTIVKVCVAVKAPSPSSVAVIVISEFVSPSVGVPDNVFPDNVNQLGNPDALTVTYISINIFCSNGIRICYILSRCSNGYGSNCWGIVYWGNYYRKGLCRS